jgi:hypothetical protein
MAAMVVLSGGVIGVCDGLAWRALPPEHDYPHVEVQDVEEGNVVPLAELKQRG